MSVRVLDYRAAQPRSRYNANNPVAIPQSSNRLTLATLQVNIPRTFSIENRVELIGTVGVKGVTGTSQIVFRIFRDGTEIYNTRDGVESDPESEQNYVFTFQAIDRNLGRGTHTYRLTVERVTTGTSAAVVGPVSFSALAISRT